MSKHNLSEITAAHKDPGNLQGTLRNSVFGLLLFASSLLVFYFSPAHYVADSAYSMLMDDAILHHGTPNMIAYKVPRGSGSGFIDGYPAQLGIFKGRLLYTFPWGAPLLSLPAVAILEAGGFKVAPQHVYNLVDEIRMQAVVSALLSATAVLLIYATAALFLSCGWALTIGLGAAFTTQIWSSVSRSLWPQTWYLLLISAVILILATRRMRPVMLATLLAWACLTRPVAVPAVAIVGVFTLIECESNRLRLIFIASGCVWTMLFATVLLFFTGHLLAPAYHAGWFLTPHNVFQELEGVLFSPSRGLLIYTPVVLLPLFLTFVYWRELPDRRLATLAVVIFAVSIAVVVSYPIWWGGWSYGPREFADIVPWLALLTAMGFKAFFNDRSLSARRRRTIYAASMLVVLVSLVMNAPGALSSSAMDWNAFVHLNEHPEQLWDWRHPPFLAWKQFARGANF